MSGLKINDYLRIMACGTGCLCILIAVSTAMIIFARNPSEQTAVVLGSLSKTGAWGVTAILVVMVTLVRVSLGGKK